MTTLIIAERSSLALFHTRGISLSLLLIFMRVHEAGRPGVGILVLITNR